MSGRAFGAPIRRAVPAKGPRPAGSWELAVRRAVETWDGLTGGGATVAYPTEAAAAILTVALALWADVAATMED